MSMISNNDELKEKTLVLLEYVGIDYLVIQKVKRFFTTLGFNKTRQFEFIQDFSRWLVDGCSPAQACEAIIKGAAENPSLAKEAGAARDILNSLEAGGKIAEGMENWFDEDVISIFKSGESASSEALIHIINEYLRQEEKMKEAKKQFWSPIKQPLLYSIIAWCVLLGMGAFMFPQFLEIIPRHKADSLLVFAVDYAKFMQNNFLFILLFIVFVCVFLINFIRNSVSPLRMKLDSVFPFNVYRLFLGMRLLKTLGILVESRYNLHTAAKEMLKYSNKYTSYHLQHILDTTSTGDNKISSALDSGLLPTRLKFRLDTASSSPNVETKKRAISIAAERSGDEATRSLLRTRKLISLFFWVLTLVGLLLVAGGFMGVISSVFNINAV